MVLRLVGEKGGGGWDDGPGGHAPELVRAYVDLSSTPQGFASWCHTLAIASISES